MIKSRSIVYVALVSMRSRCDSAICGQFPNQTLISEVSAGSLRTSIVGYQFSTNQKKGCSRKCTIVSKERMLW